MSQNICLSRIQTHLRLDRALLKDANLHLTKKRGTGFQKAAQCQPDVTVFVQLMRHKAANLHLTKHLRLDRAQLMRHKDANLHLTKNCGTGFQKAAQNPEQSNQADATVIVYREPHNIFKAWQGSADAPECKPALDEQVRFQKQSNCLSRTKWTHLRLDGSADAPHKDANWHLTKKCGTGFQKAAQNPEQSNQADVYLVTENKMDTFKARQGSAEGYANLHLTKKRGAGCHGVCSADAPQGCKPALDQAFKARQSSADAPQGCKLALDQEVQHCFQKAAQYQPYLSIETSVHI